MLSCLVLRYGTEDYWVKSLNSNQPTQIGAWRRSQVFLVTRLPTNEVGLLIVPIFSVCCEDKMWSWQRACFTVVARHDRCLFWCLNKAETFDQFRTVIDHLLDLRSI